MVHSTIYYQLNKSIISDYDFDHWSKELVDLQAKYPEIAAECVYHDRFKDFDGSTGFHLSDDPWAFEKAQQLLRHHRERSITV